MSARLHTHYDNLKVAPDASDEVIRAAYRALSQKHHPDRNPDDPDAHRIMSLINQSYAVLSDPAQRRAHDAWIAEQQHLASLPVVRIDWPLPAARRAPPPPKPSRWQWLAMAGIVVLLVGLWWLWQSTRADTIPPQPQTQTAAPAIPTAPNGQALPAHKGYVDGYPLLRQRGGNVIRVDNSALGSGVFAQLYELRHGKLTAIRSFYIPAGEHFSIGKVGDGDFSLHYQRLDTGQWQVSEPWQISNTERSGQYRHIDVKL